MDRKKDIQNNKFKVLLSIRDDRKKKEEPRMKKLVHKIIQRVRQFRIVGYITIGIGMYKMGMDIQELGMKLFFIILFTELASKHSSPQLDELKDDIDKVVDRGRD